jgi:hypothetical protein
MNHLNNFNQQLLKASKILMTTGLFMLLFFQVSAQSSSVNFSGSWALNESKSKLGDGPFRMASSTLVVKQEGNTLSIDRTMPGRDGEEMKMSGKYTLDGKVCENKGIMDMKTKSTVTWSADKKSITIASSTLFEMNGESMEMKSSEIWKSGDGGKTLIVEATNATPDGEFNTTLVYDKK